MTPAVRQRGVSMWSFIFFLAFGGFVMIMGFRCVPVWTEYFAAVKLVKKLETSGVSDPTKLRKEWDLVSSVDRIDSVTGKDLSIVPAGNGRAKISFDYDKEIHIAFNAYLLFRFSSEGVAGQADEAAGN